LAEDSSTGVRVDDDVLVVSFVGLPSFDALKAFARDAIERAVKGGFAKLLADLQGLEASPGAVERLLLGSLVAERWPRHVRLAVLIPREMNTPDHLFENAASQKGVPVIVSDSYDEAMRWLHHPNAGR
jgi:hypothetical protein